jgi:uncharacterized protein YjbI with pentapeptide repeats
VPAGSPGIGRRGLRRFRWIAGHRAPRPEAVSAGTQGAAAGPAAGVNDRCNADAVVARAGGADLGAADLIGADLARTLLDFANLRDADASYANRTDAHLDLADLTDADLTGTTFEPGGA